jgi:hypothetical protein
MKKKSNEPTKTLLYYSGSVAIEDYLPEINDDPNLGVLFTFFDIPKKRFNNIKKKVRREQNKKRRGLK